MVGMAPEGHIHHYVHSQGGYYCDRCGSWYRPPPRGGRRRGRNAAIVAVLAAGLLAAGAVAAWTAPQEGPGGPAAQDPGGAAPQQGAPAAALDAGGGAPPQPDGPEAPSRAPEAPAGSLFDRPAAREYPGSVMIRGERHDANDYADVPSDGAESRQSLEAYALALANAARADHGLPPVAPSGTPSAHEHARDMLDNGYHSHWNTDGVKPYAAYTGAGGRGLVGENIGSVEYYCPREPCSRTVLDPYEEVRYSHWGMVYDDAHAGWGHRDNILDPEHTHANFGVAYDDERLYLVQHFETKPVDWDVELDGPILRVSGDLPPGYTVSAIGILNDPEPRSLSAHTLDNVSPYSDGYYEWGELVMQYVQPGRYAKCHMGTWPNGSPCVPYEIFEVTDRIPEYAAIEADVGRHLAGDGIHTAVVWLTDGRVNVPTSGITLEFLK